MNAQQQPSKIRGWKAIAAALDVDARTARRYMRRAERPLRVRRDHKGYYCEAQTLHDWLRGEEKTFDELVEGQLAS